MDLLRLQALSVTINSFFVTHPSCIFLKHCHSTFHSRISLCTITGKELKKHEFQVDQYEKHCKEYHLSVSLQLLRLDGKQPLHGSGICIYG